MPGATGGPNEHFAALLLRSWPRVDILSPRAPHAARPGSSGRPRLARGQNLSFLDAYFSESREVHL